jgi:hypothetical protein
MTNMKSVRWITVAIAVLMVATLSCGPTGGSTPTEAPTAVLEPTVAPTTTLKPTPEQAPATPSPEGASLEITNNSDASVAAVYVSLSKSDEWGQDWLRGQEIGVGQSGTISGIPVGTYDLRAVDENDGVIEYGWNVKLDGAVPWMVTGLMTVKVTNRSSQPIAQLYVSSVDSTTWGDNVLGGDEITPMTSYVVRGLRRGSYDLKAAGPDEASIEVAYNVALYGEAEWTVTGVATMPDNAVLRFSEDFSDNRNNWGVVETEDTNYMAPADGEYCIRIKAADTTAWEWYEPFRTDEFIAQLQCYVDGDEDASCGLGYGPDGDNLYWFEVSAADQHYALFLLENDEWQDTPIDWTASTAINPAGPNWLSLQRVGGAVSLFINGVLVGEVRSDRFPEGRVGLGGATYDDANATICMDNLTVYRFE